MGICFVIQPFDNDEFDKRYEEIFVPAIKAAGLEPYRVDRDPGVTIVIDEIEAKIKNSMLCLAEITLPNPNVWYEVGYAAASNKHTVFVCSNEVTKFPFDIQHKKIIRYKKGSISDFKQFEMAITEKIKALLNNEKTIEKISSSPIKETEGLSQHEMLALISIMQNRNSPREGVFLGNIQNDMERAGSTQLAANLALTRLLRKEMIEYKKEFAHNSDPFYVYLLTEKGEDWLINNEDKLNLHQKFEDMNDKDIPF